MANSIQDIREDYLEQYGKFKANSRKFTDDSHQITTLDNLIAMTKLEIQLQQLFALEEVAIDRYLQKNYMQSKINNLDTVEFANSVRYLRKNLINAKNALLWLKDHHDTLLASLSPERSVELDNSAESLRQLVLEIKSIEAEIENY